MRARVRAIPVVAGHVGCRVWRALEHIVLAVRDPLLHRVNFVANTDHRRDEPIQFGLGFALGRFHHHRARHRKRHRRRMEAVVHEPFRDVFHLNAGHTLEAARVENALVRDQSVLPAIEHGIVRLESLGDVVGVEDGHLGGQGHPFTAHEPDVDVRDRQDAGAAPRCGRHRTNGMRTARRDDGMRWQERHKLRRDTDRPHARTTAAMRDAEGLVQVEMADVRSQITGARQTHHRIHVRPVHVHLSTV